MEWTKEDDGDGSTCPCHLYSLYFPNVYLSFAFLPIAITDSHPSLRFT